MVIQVCMLSRWMFCGCQHCPVSLIWKRQHYGVERHHSSWQNTTCSYWWQSGGNVIEMRLFNTMLFHSIKLSVITFQKDNTRPHVAISLLITSHSKMSMCYHGLQLRPIWLWDEQKWRFHCLPNHLVALAELGPVLISIKYNITWAFLNNLVSSMWCRHCQACVNANGGHIMDPVIIHLTLHIFWMNLNDIKGFWFAVILSLSNNV